MDYAQTTTDEAAMRANVTQLVEGWNAHDGAAFAAPFATNADYVVIDGRHISGRPAIAAGHQQIFDTIYKDSTLTYTVEQVRFLRPDVALVHCAGVLTVRHGGQVQTGQATISLVMTKDGQVWSIAAFHNTPAAMPG